MLQTGDSPPWVPFSEPLRATIVRTFALAVVLGGVVVVASAHRIGWLPAVVVALWPAFGGHWIELWFLNWLRPRIARERSVQLVARLATWVVGGIVLALMMRETARLLAGIDVPFRAVWLGGVAFVAVELIAHAALAARNQPGFYNGRG